MAENTINEFNTLPEQVQLNKEDIETLNAKIDTITSNIANLRWELKTNTSGDNTDGYFCSLSMAAPNDKTNYLVVTYIANSNCPQSLNSDKYKEDSTIATMGWVNKYYLTKTDASNTYATKSAIKTLEYDYFDAVLTPSGFAKIQANATIGNSITLFRDTDFTEDIYNIDLKHKTVIFNLYQNNEDLYISTNIKLDIGSTTSYYSDNDQPAIWYTGIGVIKLGSAAAFGNNYLCYIAYDTSYNNGLIITPIKKLN